MNKIPTSADDLIGRFLYRPDVNDTWRILDEEDGSLIGDCEDFSLTMAIIQSNWSLVKFWWLVTTCQIALWHVKTQAGESHVTLWVRGKGWICNIYPTWRESTPHKRVFPYWTPILLLTLLTKRS